MKFVLTILTGVLLSPGIKANKGDTLVPIGSQAHGVIDKKRLNVQQSGKQVYAPATELSKWDFSNSGFGDIPEGWTDLLYRRPSRNWMIDGEGYLRHVLKYRNNRLTYEPFSNSFL